VILSPPKGTSTWTLEIHQNCNYFWFHLFTGFRSLCYPIKPNCSTECKFRFTWSNSTGKLYFIGIIPVHLIET